MNPYFCMYTGDLVPSRANMPVDSDIFKATQMMVYQILLVTAIQIVLQALISNTFMWRHNERDGVSNHLRIECLLNCLFRWRSKKMSKFRVTDLCVGNSPMTGEFPAQRASNAENAAIWWRHHDTELSLPIVWFITGTEVSPSAAPYSQMVKGRPQFGS